VRVTRGSGRGINQETPPMRIYIIGNDGITLCREAPASVTDGEIAVVSNQELHAAPLSGSAVGRRTAVGSSARNRRRGIQP
jgi:hypothetical protein